jgi:hypothetical protein
VHDDHVRAGLLDLGQQVAGHQHGAPALGVAAQQLAHGVDLRRVEPVGRLVEHQQLGQPEHRLGDGQPLAHPLAVGADPALDRGAQPGDLEGLGHVRLGGGRRSPPSKAPGWPAGQVRQEAGPSTNAPSRPARGARADRLPERLDRPGGGPDQAHQHPQHGGLAGAVGTEQAQHHAPLGRRRRPPSPR